MITAVPAYGRDYSSAAKVKEDWNAGKDFRMEPGGQMINKEDAARYAPGQPVNIRYAKLRKVVVI